jgi:hypothetical protein
MHSAELFGVLDVRWLMGQAHAEPGHIVTCTR